MNRNVLYLVIGALAVVAGILGYQFYQERQKTTGVEINIGERGISIEKK
jgi:predicted negative regulator of RcsB-dependent stress response